MRVILIGPQGSGKGTQGVRLSERFDVPHVATGDLLRAAVRAQTPLGLKAKSFMDAGELVPDDLVLEILRERLEAADARAGFILDGYPRTPAQAEALRSMLDEIGQGIDVVVSLEVPDDILVERLGSRTSCPKCGRPYSIGQYETCPVDGTKLFQRTDDTPDAVRRRLQIFHEQTSPLIEHYESSGLVVHVDGVGEVGDVEDRIAKALEVR